jgi:dolichol-phosphate mannosyltransferase
MNTLIQKIKAVVQERHDFLLYVSIGFTGLTLDLITFIVLVRIFHMGELIANPISMSVGIVNNFFLNAYFNFKKTDRLLSRLASFYSVGVVGIIVGDIILWLFNDVLGPHVHTVLAFFSAAVASYQLELVKAVSIVIIAVMQYFLNKRFSFKN